MAEYVRRRKPPPSHPYWARLHDRAHPPPLFGPIVTATIIGLGMGLYSGMRPTFAMSEAVRVAGFAAAGVAGAAFFIGASVLAVDASRQMSRHERWAAAAVGGTVTAAVVFIVIVFVLIPILAWYSACSGKGPWLGMLYGALISGVPVAGIAAISWQRWNDRQKHWPRWERMRTLSRRTSLNIVEVPSTPSGSGQSTPLQSESSPAINETSTQ